MQVQVDWVLIISGTQVIKKRPVRPFRNCSATEDLIQAELSKGIRDLGTKDFVDLKEKGLGLAT